MCRFPRYSEILSSGYGRVMLLNWGAFAHQFVVTAEYFLCRAGLLAAVSPLKFAITCDSAVSTHQYLGKFVRSKIQNRITSELSG